MKSMINHSVQLIKVEDSFHHCASVASDGSMTILAAYCGQECTDSQRVFITFNDEFNDYSRTKFLDNKTGNPLVWHENDKFLIMYSKFIDVDEAGNVPSHPVDRWKFCENHLAEIVISEDSIELVNDHVIEGAFGLLARCSPIVYNNRSLWPLYKEKDPVCEIWTYDGTTLKPLSKFGEYLESYKAVFGNLGIGVAIQPSLVVLNNKLNAFCRNVTRNYKYAWVARSDDGVNWSDLEQTAIPNGNSSLVNISGTSLFVFNDTPSRERLVLASLNSKKGIVIDIPVISQRNSTGYPNYCWHNDNLIIVHSNRNYIAEHRYTKDYLKLIFGNEL